MSGLPASLLYPPDPTPLSDLGRTQASRLPAPLTSYAHVSLVPSVSSVPNGRLCPSCYVEGASQCKRMEPLPCTGAEDRCVEFTGTLSAGNACVNPHCPLRAGTNPGVRAPNTLKEFLLLF